MIKGQKGLKALLSKINLRNMMPKWMNEWEKRGNEKESEILQKLCVFF